jgi:hypothetical protein
MELLQILEQKLGISEEQAKAGVGLILKLVKEKLDPEEFDEVSGAVPGAEDLIASSPKSGGIAGALGGIASSFGGAAGQLGGIAGIASGFKKLNLDADMVGKFIPIILSFVESKGGSTVKAILEKVLK